jgi:hypothetical protein
MIRKYIINKVLKMLKKENIDSEYCSPNFVADFSYNRGINLLSDEVVAISNQYGEDL